MSITPKNKINCNEQGISPEERDYGLKSSVDTALSTGETNSAQLAELTNSEQISKKDDYLLSDGLEDYIENEYWNTENDVVIVASFVGAYKRSEPIPITAGDVITAVI